MKKLDENEDLIIRELIKDPRISDNQIARNTNVPVMTVNRKRKKLEEENIIQYFTRVNRTEDGMSTVNSSQLYIITLSAGITTKDYYIAIEKDNYFKRELTRFVDSTYVGELAGHLAILMCIETKKQAEQIEVFNGKVIPWFKETFGKNSVRKITTVGLNHPLRLHHNYFPKMNMKNARIKKEYPDEFLYTDD